MHPATHCPTAPAGESHRWRIPLQGHGTEQAICKWCGVARRFALSSNANPWPAARLQAARRGGAVRNAHQPTA
jgi:hypothetical protein